MKNWFKRFRPHAEVTRVHEESVIAKREAEEELGEALSLAHISAEVVRDLNTINYRNGFSVALGQAFAKKGTA